MLENTIEQDDLINRQEAIDKLNERQRELVYCFGFENDIVKVMDIAKSIVIAMPPAQPEITLEQAIKRLHELEWLQKHDRELIEFTQAERRNTKRKK